MRKRIYLSDKSTLTRKKTDKIVGYVNTEGNFVPYKKHKVGSQVQIMVVSEYQADEYDRISDEKFQRRIAEDTTIN